MVFLHFNSPFTCMYLAIPFQISSGGMGVSDVAACAARRAAALLFVLLSAFMSSSTTDDAGNVHYTAGVDAQR